VSWGKDVCIAYRYVPPKKDPRNNDVYKYYFLYGFGDLG
jgi:hypothetical protein